MSSEAGSQGMMDTWTVRPPVDVQPRGSVTVRQWCRAFDVIDALLPFGYKSYDPIEYVRGVRKAVEDAPPTKASFTVSELTNDIDHRVVSHGNYLPVLLRTAGLWEYCETSRHTLGGATTRWANPEYIHAHAAPAITDERERVEELRRSASLGIFVNRDIAPRFGGESKSTVRQFCQSRGIPLNEWREWGRRRMARTLKIAFEWTDHTFTDLSEVMGFTRNISNNWVRGDYAADFDVPEDPSGEPWFNPSRRGGW
jgi:hypothetical protein